MEVVVVAVAITSCVANAGGFLVGVRLMRRLVSVEKSNAMLCGLVVGLCKANGVEVPDEVAHHVAREVGPAQ